MTDSHRALPVEPTQIWDEVFTVAPLILVGTKEAGGYDIAPKHMAMPLGWDGYFAFACSPDHATHRNIVETGEFAVTYPRPEQVVEVGQAAAPRTDDGTKPSLGVFTTFPASKVDAPLVEGGYLFVECEAAEVLGPYGSASLIVGTIVAASVDPAARRTHDLDDADLIHDAPLLAFLSPERLGVVNASYSFPFPHRFHR